MREHPIIQCVKCNSKVHARVGDEAECSCGNLIVEIAAGGYLRVHSASEDYVAHFPDEEE
jgi:hypothetical protein